MINVSRLNIANAEDIEKVESACFGNPWSIDSIKSSLNRDDYAFFGAFDGDIICGYGGVNVILDEGYITNIGVLPQYRNKRIGQLLVNELIEYAKSRQLSFLTLEVRLSNNTAIKLYEKNGFINAGIRKGFYSNPFEDGAIMTLVLNYR